jgi:ribulose-phosphate 3-epimerase
MFFDAHLMMSDPVRYLDAFIAAGCDQIIVHVEAVPHPADAFRRIRAAGCLASLAFNPPTPVEAVLPHLGEIDSLLVMSVTPGFGGQAFQAPVLDKVRAVRKRHPDLAIAIDGGISATTAADATEAGVTQLVAGSSVFKGGRSYAEALAELTEAGRLGIQRRLGAPPA